MHQKSRCFCKSVCEKPVCVMDTDPKFVAAGPLHLAYARPLRGLKAPLGLSLLRKRQVCRGEATPSCLRKTALWLKSPTGAFIAAQTPIPPFHSLFSSELWFLFAPTARCAAFGVIGTAPNAKEKQKRDMQLDHLRAPFFVFIRKTASPSPSSLRDATSPEGRASCASTERYYFWFEEKRLSQMQRSSPFRGSWHRSAMPERVYFTISASSRYTSSAPPLGALTFTNWLFTMAVPSE